MLIFLTIACSVDLPEPEPRSVEPRWGYNGEETGISVSGQNFIPQIRVNAGAEGGAEVDQDFQLRLEGSGGSYDLDAVTFVDLEHLDATVPSGLPPGSYDLVVLTPTQVEGRLESAFVVTDSRADHFTLSWEARAYQVLEQVFIGIQLADPGDNPVYDSLPVKAWVEADEGTEGLVFASGGLVDEVALAEGNGFTGSLDEAGQGWLAFTATTPMNAWVNIAPLDTDSIVEAERVFVPFTAGDLNQVVITLPAAQFEASAGESFTVVFELQDAFGNPLEDQAAELQLMDACGGSVSPATVDVIGRKVTEVTFTHATDSSCAQTQLLVGGGGTGESEPFTVSPGAPALLSIGLHPSSPSSVVAGESDLLVITDVRDAYGNRAVDYAEELRFIDEAGGLDTAAGVGSVSCEYPWTQGFRVCSLSLERASDATRITATDGTLSASFGPVEVLAAAPTALEAWIDASSLVAGDSFELFAVSTDDFGNTVTLDPSSLFEVDDGYGTAECVSLGSDASGVTTLDCTSTTAAPSVSFDVQAPDLGLVASTPAVAVLNNSLAVLDLLLPAAVVAGDTFTVKATGYDAWGNPYLVGDPAVTLADDSATLSPVTFNLASNGTYTGGGYSITRSGLRRVSATKGGLALGDTDIEVNASSPVQLVIDLDSTFAWLDQPLSGEVYAVDVYDNLVDTYSSVVSIESADGLFGTTEVSDFDAGRAELALTWTTAGLADQVLASNGTLSGSSGSVDALDPACGGGPAADLTLDGADVGVACRVSGSAIVSVDLGGSSAGDAALAAYHTFDGESWARSTAPSSRITVSEVGARRITAVVADAAACGAIVSSELYVNDPGEAAGPVTVTVADSSRVAGSSVDGATTVTVEAVDCAGDVPTVTDLYVRTDIGELTGVTTASDGLVATLSGGSATFTWSVAAQSFAGLGTVYAGVLSGAAWGIGELEVTGDSARPQVVACDPEGVSSGEIASIEVQFSEAIADQDHSSNLSLVGPDGSVSVSTLVSDDTLIITPDSVVDAGLGEWTLTVSQGVRDLDGNRLDGAWSGTRSDFVTTFGDVVDDGIEVSSCLGPFRITPDGAGGSGDEADVATLQATATTTPNLWRLEILDEDGAWVRTQTTVATGSTASLSWDARGSDGIIVPSGVYGLRVWTVDAQGNASAACEVEVEVLHHFGELP